MERLDCRPKAPRATVGEEGYVSAQLESLGAQAAAAVAAASAAVGRRLAALERLGGSDRSVVLRCQDEAGGALVVKTYPADGTGPASFAAEAAGLTVASGTGLAPELLAADSGSLTLVMSDLGRGPSLADALLGSSADTAGRALLGWARECGALSAACSERIEDFETLKYRYLAGRPDVSDAAQLRDLVLRAGNRAAALAARPGTVLAALRVPEGLAAELRAVADAVRPDRYPVFTPGDACPDNNLVSGETVRFLDFEGSGRYCAFLDAAYIRMPFSTCWCVFRLPGDLAAEAEAAYRAQVASLHPELACDPVWENGLRSAVAAWSLSSFNWLLDRALEGDVAMDAGRVSPTTRQVIRHRWHVLLAELAGGGLPALAELTQSLLDTTESWQAHDLPLYPAFR
jgi:hypothetical protein